MATMKTHGHLTGKRFGRSVCDVRAAGIAILFLLGRAALAADQVSDIESDYEIVFFPAIAHASNSAAKDWDVEIHGCVYENEKHRLALATLREALALDRIHLTTPEKQRLNERTRLFMVDHKSGRKVVIQIGDHIFTSAKTRDNGEFLTKVRLSDEDVRNLGPGPVEFKAVLARKDNRVFKGIIFFAPASGISVISDIDDTIKVTQVLDRRAALKNTFLEPFKAVAGMPQLYRNWATNEGAQFYYVSASPWQLFLPLADFLKANNFPVGVFCLKEFRLKDNTRFSIFENPQKYKPEIIEPILKNYPERRFVLIGDSGESDPEIYGDLTRKFQKQISHIFIRDVTGEAGESSRYKQAFRDLPAGLWTVFHDPAEITAVKLKGE
jgi:phosphatidate phosphatase APP1